MTDPVLACQNDARRDLVRARERYYGLDYVEVSADQLTLTVTLLGEGPESLTRQQVAITGGRRITDIGLTADPQIRSSATTGSDALLIIKVDRPGDFSTYTLTVTHPGFDPRYASVDFSFKVDCNAGLDCAPDTTCPPQPLASPEINYLAKDYASFRQLILDRLALVLPQWQETHVPDIGTAIVDILAYTGDQLSYYQDAVATEAYLGTARKRISVRRHARLVDYHLHEGCNARVWLRFETDHELDLDPATFFLTTSLPLPQFKPILAASDLEQIDASVYESFQIMIKGVSCRHEKRAPQPATVHLNPALNSISFYTWKDSECCLPKGAMRATLVGDAKTLGLQVGDFLMLVEVLGPETGVDADADPARRQVVCLTSVTASSDPLDGTAVTEIEWGREDALQFALCLSSIGDPPDCKLLSDVSVAWGNIFPADHGGLIRDPGAVDPPSELAPDTVPAVDVPQRCCGVSDPTDPAQIAGRYRPRLLRGPLTFAVSSPDWCPASGLLIQDPVDAVPQIALSSLPVATTWTAQPDLLDSGPDDAHYVVEIDDDGLANLRFGDGVLGQSLDPGMHFVANYRLGNGRAGNVGANTISHLVFWNGVLGGAAIKVSNPMAASGGIDPEPIENARQIAPFAFRQRIERAITPSDYATLASTPYEASIRRAQARFLWTGSWYEADVAVEPYASSLTPGKDVIGPGALLDRVERHLYRYRRIFHDVRVRAAELVPIELVLSVCVLPGYLRAHVRSRLLDLFGNRTLSDGTLGFFHPDNVSLGQGVMVSRIIALAQAVDGVENVAVTRLRREFEPDSGELAAGILRVLPWELPQLDNDPSFPERGTLTLNLGGGR